MPSPIEKPGHMPGFFIGFGTLNRTSKRGYSHVLRNELRT